MIGSSVYTKLRNIFPKELQNINLSEIGSDFVDQSQALSFLISSTLPHLSIDQIHNLCKRQQKNVMDKILEIKQFDLYQQIAEVCPSQKNLKTMPTDEVISKINQFTQRMALQQKMSEQSDSEIIDYSQLQQAIIQRSPEKMLQPMEIQQIHYQSINSIKGLNNIFEQQYNSHNHLPWNEICIYDLN